MLFFERFTGVRVGISGGGYWAVFVDRELA